MPESTAELTKEFFVDADGVDRGRYRMLDETGTAVAIMLLPDEYTIEYVLKQTGEGKK